MWPWPTRIRYRASLLENVDRESTLHTDESRLYTGADAHFAAHETVKHSIKEYVRGDVHTNTIEGAFSIFKRGMKGVYQHCKEKHLHRYLAEFDFRYNHQVRSWMQRYCPHHCGREEGRRQAPYVPATSLNRFSNIRRGDFCAGERSTKMERLVMARPPEPSPQNPQPNPDPPPDSDGTGRKGGTPPIRTK